MSVKSKLKSAVKAVKRAVKKEIPLLEQPFQVREIVFVNGLNELMQQTGVGLSIATRDTLVPETKEEVVVPKPE